MDARNTVPPRAIAWSVRRPGTHLEKPLSGVHEAADSLRPPRPTVFERELSWSPSTWERRRPTLRCWSWVERPAVACRAPWSAHIENTGSLVQSNIRRRRERLASACCRMLHGYGCQGPGRTRGERCARVIKYRAAMPLSLGDSSGGCYNRRPRPDDLVTAARPSRLLLWKQET